ncbi:MAG: PrgI family protein [Candidatus Buchananbacteria bacterium]|nr:PrgI family protein [Candidatus Buchananbacteria bacterium]
MERIVVPQFLEIEDTIIGPVTVRQFLEMLIAGLLIFIYYKLFDFGLFILLGIVTLLVTIVVAFVKINGQPFHFFLLNFFATFKSPKLKVWKKQFMPEDIVPAVKAEKVIAPSTAPVRVVTASRLSELSLMVDTGGTYHGER